MGITNGTLSWADSLVGNDLDGATALSLFITWQSQIPLAINAHPDGTGLISKWFTILPAGNRVFRFRRNGTQLQFTLANGLFVGELFYDRITISSPISTTVPTLYRIALRWQNVDDLEIFVNSTVSETIDDGPDDSGYAPGSLIAFSSQSNLRVGVNQGFGPETQVNGCRSEVAVLARRASNDMIADYMGGIDITRWKNPDGVVYAHLVDTTDVTDVWNGHTAIFTTGGSGCPSPPLLPVPSLNPTLGTIVDCGQAFAVNPCPQGCR